MENNKMKTNKLKGFLKIKKPEDKYIIRLPTIDELYNVFNRELNKPKMDGFSSSFYWSSTAYESNLHYVWGVYFGDGYVGGISKDENRCVRYVKEYEDGHIEWLNSLDRKMTWCEAMEYADNLNKE